MIAQRRTRYNFALQHAVDRARQFGKPLVVFEPLRIRYRWASDRLHRFIIEGMRDNAADLAGKCATYLPYVEPQPGNGTPLLHELAKHAVTVVTDEYPCFFLPRMIRTVKDRIPARLELVDSNGVIPLRMPNRDFTVAHSFRRWMQKNILDLLLKFPEADPLAGEPLPKLRRLPASVTDRWQPADLDHLLTPGGLGRIPIDHDVTICPETPGGSAEAESRLERFLSSRLEHYGDLRNHPDEHATTELSPHLHFGHIAAHEIVQRLLDHESWTPDQASAPNGKNHSFWNTSGPAEAFLDQILTWREIGFNEAFRHPDTYDKLSSLPQWAQNSLRETAGDPRPYLYSLDQLEHAETHDDLWNAAQREIVQTGMMHNYMRMLWGKKILQWTESPQQALDFMIHLNNKYGLDGRDPNSYCGILWVLGRTDRAWGPKRPVYGAVRYMTSESAQTKLKLKKYLRRFGS
ncbi:MAG: deoxyribodipyrimidine photolyase [Planctomycetota bacterium]